VLERAGGDFHALSGFRLKRKSGTSETCSVIVTCERCETEFQLDDTRVPATGARVRCSRCKHAFFVMPPAASPNEAVDQIAGLALTAEADSDDTTIPEVTEDLPEPSARPQSSRGADAAPAAPAAAPPTASRTEEDESDWEFNGKLPADPGDSSPHLHTVRAPDASPRFDADLFGAPEEDLSLASPRAGAASPAARTASSSGSDDLGSPVDWDFLDRQDERPATAPALPPRAISVPREIALDGTGTAAPREIPAALRHAVAGAGWLATASLCALALLRGLAPPPAPAATAWASLAPGLALEQVRARWLDNVSLGRLYVVSGRVHNTADTAASLPPLVLELRDGAGRAVGQPVALRGASAPGSLRDADAAAFATAGSDFPGGLAAGVSWDFEAVVWPIPAQAARFAIRSGS
jgi:predicted Zn finger-like uncharacterized protein